MPGASAEGVQARPSAVGSECAAVLGYGIDIFCAGLWSQLPTKFSKLVELYTMVGQFVVVEAVEQ